MIYIPLCWFLYCYRRASVWYYEEELYENDDVKFGVTKDERKKALEKILEPMIFRIGSDSQLNGSINENDIVDLEECKEEEEKDSLDEDDSNVCSICLQEYGKKSIDRRVMNARNLSIPKQSY